MGFFDDLKSAFSGGSSKKSGSSSKSKSSKDSTPTFKSLSEAAKAGYHGQAVNIAGKGKQKVSFGDKSYDKKMAAASNAASKSSGSGIKSLGTALKNAPKNIASDIGMGFGLKDRDADYYRRTANTIARTQGADAANQYIKQMTAKGGLAAAGVKSADVDGSVKYGQQTGMLNVGGGGNDGRGIAGLRNTISKATEPNNQSQYDENLRRYQEFMQGQNALTVAPQRPEVTPDMRREALNIFESQQGAGQVPYYMAAARNAQNPNMSPAFQYAAQNYDVLGGSQRIAPRPMEMMSVAERQRINDMAQGMADQQYQQDQYQRGMDMVLRGGGKGGPRTGPQLPPGMVGLPRDPVMMPRFGGKGGGGAAPQMPSRGMPRSDFASILASRFGGFGG